MACLRESLPWAISEASFALAASYCLMSAFSSSFSAAISSGSETIRMFLTRTASWVPPTRSCSASADSTTMPPVTAFMPSRIAPVRTSAMVDSVGQQRQHEAEGQGEAAHRFSGWSDAWGIRELLLGCLLRGMRRAFLGARTLQVLQAGISSASRRTRSSPIAAAASLRPAAA
jgi:hypothetical protein